MTKRLVRICFVALACWLCGLNLLTPARAQDDGNTRTATLLPVTAMMVVKKVGSISGGPALAIAADVVNAPTAGIYLQFDPTTLPRGACVEDWKLKVYPQTTGEVQQLVRVFPAITPPSIDQIPPESLAFASINQEDRSKQFAHDVGEKQPPCSWATSKLSLMLLSQSPGLTYAYHGLAASCDQQEKSSSPEKAPFPCNIQPRLIVRYHMPLAAADPSWSQERSDPQQSGRTAWQVSPGSGGLTVAGPSPVYQPKYQPKGYIMGAPVMHQGRLIFHTQQVLGEGSWKFFMTAVDRRGKAAWGKDVDIQAVAKFSPAVDRQGRLYVVTENCLLVMNAEDGNFLKRSCLSGSCPQEPCTGKSLLGVKDATSVRATPTLGANGALYLSTNRGVFALTPYPELRVLWRFGGDGFFGQAALSADEATAYVLDGGAGQLVAIDVADGTERWRGKKLDKPGWDNNKVLPVPVVGTKLVYVVNGYQQGDSLQVFAEKTCAGNTSAACPPLRSIEGSISRPVIAREGQAYFVKDGSLCRWELATQKDPRCILPKPVKSSTDTTSFSSQSQLGVDEKGNVYVMDGVSKPQKVRGYGPDLEEFLQFDVPATGSDEAGTSTVFGTNLLMGPDGTLYNVNVSALFAFGPVPTAKENERVLSAADINTANRTTFLAAKFLRVKGEVTVKPAQSLIFKSGCGIKIGPEFKVATGARVLMQTGGSQASECPKP